jgi:hypothetical protein
MLETHQPARSTRPLLTFVVNKQLTGQVHVRFSHFTLGQFFSSGVLPDFEEKRPYKELKMLINIFKMRSW